MLSFGLELSGLRGLESWQYSASGQPGTVHEFRVRGLRLSKILGLVILRVLGLM